VKPLKRRQSGSKITPSHSVFIERLPSLGLVQREMLDCPLYRAEGPERFDCRPEFGDASSFEIIYYISEQNINVTLYIT